MSTKKCTRVQFIFDALISQFDLKGYKGLAEYIDVPYQTLMKWKMRGNIGDVLPFMDKGISRAWLDSGEGPMFLAETEAYRSKIQEGLAGGVPRPEVAFDVPQASRRIPVISWAQAGVEGFFVDSHVVGGGFTDISCPYDVSDPSAYALEISGDSMSPKYEDGDYVVVSPARGVQIGNDAIVKLRDGQVMAKRIKAKNGEFVLSSLNPSYEDLHYKAENILFMHRIVWVKPRG